MMGRQGARDLKIGIHDLAHLKQRMYDSTSESLISDCRPHGNKSCCLIENSGHDIAMNLGYKSGTTYRDIQADKREAMVYKSLINH